MFFLMCLRSWVFTDAYAGQFECLEHPVKRPNITAKNKSRNTNVPDEIPFDGQAVIHPTCLCGIPDDR